MLMHTLHKHIVALADKYLLLQCMESYFQTILGAGTSLGCFTKASTQVERGWYRVVLQRLNSWEFTAVTIICGSMVILPLQHVAQSHCLTFTKMVPAFWISICFETLDEVLERTLWIIFSSILLLSLMVSTVEPLGAFNIDRLLNLLAPINAFSTVSCEMNDSVTSNK